MRIILFLFFIFFYISLSAINQKQNDNFEGVIQFKKETLSDTLFYNYYFKGSTVSIDNYTKTGKILNCKIIDFNKGEIKIVNPKRKLYIQKYVKTKKQFQDTSLSIIKTKNYKYIIGHKCWQWIVKNRNNKSVVSYWVTNKKYNYFNELLIILDDTEKISKYFSLIKKTTGYIPLLSIERSWLRTRRMSISAEKIINLSIDDSLFEIPDDYEIFN